MDDGQYEDNMVKSSQTLKIRPVVRAQKANNKDGRSANGVGKRASVSFDFRDEEQNFKRGGGEVKFAHSSLALFAP